MLSSFSVTFVRCMRQKFLTAVLFIVASTTAFAQSLDGEWPGRMECGAYLAGVSGPSPAGFSFALTVNSRSGVVTGLVKGDVSEEKISGAVTGDRISILLDGRRTDRPAWYKTVLEGTVQDGRATLHGFMQTPNGLTKLRECSMTLASKGYDAARMAEKGAAQQAALQKQDAERAAADRAATERAAAEARANADRATRERSAADRALEQAQLERQAAEREAAQRNAAAAAARRIARQAADRPAEAKALPAPAEKSADKPAESSRAAADRATRDQAAAAEKANADNAAADKASAERAIADKAAADRSAIDAAAQRAAQDKALADKAAADKRKTIRATSSMDL